ncbi:NfeD family protein [Solidesulfovibrio sp.]
MSATSLLPARAGQGIFALLLLVALLLTAGPARAVTVFEASIAASISPAQADMLDDALRTAAERRADMLLLFLDTPGGSIDVMRRMVSAILNAPLPVVVYVAPAGARAASAGMFLTAAASVAAMAPQTTIGAASPVAAGGDDIGSTMDKKIRNDLHALVRGLADKHGRNVNWYKRAVDQAATLTAAEAVAEKVVDCIAVDKADLLVQIGKRGLPTAQGGRLRFDGSQAQFVAFEPGLWYGLLSWLLDPQIAYILLLVGVAGLFFELTTPGAILPGVVGGLSLLLALYALSVLPTNAAGLLLLLFAGGLFLLEVHVTSFGLLSLAGVGALFLGSLLLFRFDGHTGLSLSLILPTVLGVSAILIGAAWILAKAQRQKPRTGVETLIGRRATVRRWDGQSGKVFVHGEIWDARLVPEANGAVVAPGQDIVITGFDAFTLLVTVPDAPR